MKILMSITLCAVMLPFFANAETIRIRADEWCPYNCVSDSETPGYMIEIAQKVFEPLGHEVDYKTLPWARAILETRKGAFEAIVGAYKEDAPDFVFPANHLGFSTEGVIGKPDLQWSYQGVDSFRQVKLGIIRDYSYGDEIDNYINEVQKNPDLTVQNASGDNALELNIKKLLKGRIDVLVSNELVFRYHLKKTGRDWTQFKKVGVTTAQEVYIAFSPAHNSSAAWAKALDEGLNRLRKSNQLQSILDKYGLEDWEQ